MLEGRQELALAMLSLGKELRKSNFSASSICLLLQMSRDARILHRQRKEQAKV